MAKANNNLAITLGCLVLFVVTDASDSPFGATRPPTTTTIATTTATPTTQAPLESSTLAQNLPRTNETHGNSTGIEEHDHQHLEHGSDLSHQQNDTLHGNNNSTLESDKLTSHGHSDAQPLAVVSSIILLIGLTLNIFVI